MQLWLELKVNRYPWSFGDLNLDHSDVSGIIWHHFKQVFMLFCNDWQKLMLVADLEIMTT